MTVTKDGGVTKAEKDTIAAVLDKYEFDAQGRSFLQQKLQWLAIADKAAQAADPGNCATHVRPETLLLNRIDALALANLPSAAAAPALATVDAAAAAAAAAAGHLRSSTALPFGSKVVVVGLKAFPELNGRQGIVQAWKPDTSRCEVRLHTGGVKALKPENVQVLAAPPHAARDQPRANKRSAPSGSGEEAPPTGSSPAKKPKHFDNSELGLDQLRAIFTECDTDGDGVVTKIEFIKACRRNRNISVFFQLPPNIRQEDGSRTQMEKLFQDMDKDSDRKIRWAEFLAYYNEVLAR
jgi:hypothetical protein